MTATPTPLAPTRAQRIMRRLTIAFWLVSILCFATSAWLLLTDNGLRQRFAPFLAYANMTPTPRAKSLEIDVVHSVPDDLRQMVSFAPGRFLDSTKISFAIANGGDGSRGLYDQGLRLVLRLPGMNAAASLTSGPRTNLFSPWNMAALPGPGGRDLALFVDPAHGELVAFDCQAQRATWSMRVDTLQGCDSGLVAVYPLHGEAETIVLLARDVGMLVFATPDGKFLNEVPVANAVFVGSVEADANSPGREIYTFETGGRLRLYSSGGKFLRPVPLRLPDEQPGLVAPVRTVDGRDALRIDFEGALPVVYGFDGKPVRILRRDDQAMLNWSTAEAQTGPATFPDGSWVGGFGDSLKVMSAQGTVEESIEMEDVYTSNGESCRATGDVYAIQVDQRTDRITLLRMRRK